MSIISSSASSPLREIFVIACSTLMLGAHAHADERPTANLRIVLQHVPQAIIVTEDPMPVVFMDVDALSKASGGALSDKALMRIRFAPQIRALEPLTINGGKTWGEKAGIAFDRISYFASFRLNEDESIDFWGLSNANAATKLLDTLKTKKFKEVSSSPLILANGEPAAINLAGRQPDNPWSGSLGKTSTVMAVDSLLARASAPQYLEQVAESKTSFADNKAFNVALEGLDNISIEARGTIVQAGVFTPLMGFAAADPEILLDANQDLTQLAKHIEQQMQQPQSGVPAYSGGIFADLDAGGTPSLAISLAYGKCEDAERAISALQERWKEGMTAQVSVKGKTVDVAKLGCAAVVNFSPKADGLDALTEFVSNYFQSGFNVLQIGSKQ